jgi:hypothetical protein
MSSKVLIYREFVNSVSIDAMHLAKGLYIYEIRNKEGLIKKGKLLKE